MKKNLNSMISRHSITDPITFIGDLFLPIFAKMHGAVYGFLLFGYEGFYWGWRYLYIHPYSSFLVEQGAKLTLNGQLRIGFRLKKKIPLPGRFRTGITLLKNSELITGKDVRIISGATIHALEGAYISIGDRTFVSYDSQIVAKKSIIIGSDCAISWNVTILDSDLHIISNRKLENPVVIGNHVLVGHGASILAGVKIGDGVIVGAGSVVTHDIPAGAVVAGVPAKIIRKGVEWQ